MPGETLSIYGQRDLPQVGDNENWYRSSCRLIFATTEDPQQALLKTMLRRIPIVISIPSLQQRPQVEKLTDLYHVDDGKKSFKTRCIYLKFSLSGFTGS